MLISIFEWIFCYGISERIKIKEHSGSQNTKQQRRLVCSKTKKYTHEPRAQSFVFQFTVHQLEIYEPYC